ncbi:MAG: hypothetical protein PHU56_03810 [Candidatus Pacebacteria bacterium]|nr:hypothetical protein [Candidatus Paceibacterota bacterium]
MPAEREPRQEIHEKEPVDFVRIFHEKLASIKPSKRGKLENIKAPSWPGEVKIKKEAVALVFGLKGQLDKYELWLDDWQDIRDKIYPHLEAEKNLKRFCEGKTTEPQVPYTSFLIESQEGKVWLLVGGEAARYLEDDALNRDEWELDRLLDVCSRYNVEKIIGDFDVTEENEGYERHIRKTRDILNQDIVGQIREERHLLDFIEKHRDILDTNTKILRFRVLAETAREAAKKQKMPYSLEGLLEDMEKENGRIIS